MNRLPRNTALLFVLFAMAIPCSSVSAQSPQPKLHPLVIHASGDLPVIVTAPHGGRLPIPGVAERQGTNVARFQTRMDSNTDLLAESLAVAMERKIGRRPFIIAARFHRKYLDANRRPEEAFENPEAKAVYECYHEAVAQACRAVTQRWGFGVLLDVHGQAALRDSVLRGTRNGQTVVHLLQRSGREAVYGQGSLFGQLALQGFNVFPPVGSEGPEHPDYTGGYTVGKHGSAEGGTVDALQLEFGADLRRSDTIEATADKLASAVAAFVQTYLPAEKQGPQAPASTDSEKAPTEPVLQK